MYCFTLVNKLYLLTYLLTYAGRPRAESADGQNAVGGAEKRTNQLRDAEKRTKGCGEEN